MEKIVAAMTVLAVSRETTVQGSSSSSISVAYVLYDDGEVKKIGPKDTNYINASRSIDWPFSLDEAKVLLQAKADGVLFEGSTNNKAVE